MTVTPLDEEEIPAGLLTSVDATSGKAKVDLPKAQAKPAESAEKSGAKSGESALDAAELDEIAPEEAALDNIEADKKAEKQSAAAVVQAAAGVPAA